MNAQKIKDSLIAHTTSIDDVVHWATKYVYQMREDWPSDTLCVVFDIDNTILMTDDRFEHVHGEERQGDFSIPEMRELYNVALALGYEIYLVTARVDFDGNMEATREELKSLGFHSYSGLFLMPQNMLTKANWSLYKYGVRTGLAQAGKHVVLNVGDNWEDLALRAPYKIPDPLGILTSFPDDYVIFIPPDHAWAAIKMPRDNN